MPAMLQAFGMLAFLAILGWAIGTKVMAFTSGRIVMMHAIVILAMLDFWLMNGLVGGFAMFVLHFILQV
jgi:hypothetical protein